MNVNNVNESLLWIIRERLLAYLKCIIRVSYLIRGFQEGILIFYLNIRRRWKIFGKRKRGERVQSRVCRGFILGLESEQKGSTLAKVVQSIWTMDIARLWGGV